MNNLIDYLLHTDVCLFICLFVCGFRPTWEFVAVESFVPFQETISPFFIFSLHVFVCLGPLPSHNASCLQHLSLRSRHLFLFDVHIVHNYKSRLLGYFIFLHNAFIHKLLLGDIHTVNILLMVFCWDSYLLVSWELLVDAQLSRELFLLSSELQVDI